MDKTLITFASEGYERSADALLKSAAPYFDNFRIYTPADIKDLMDEHPAHFVNSKGFGWWAWKPYIILDALKQTNPGDVVMYTDACLEFVRSPEELLIPDADCKVFSSGQRHIDYCKSYALEVMRVTPKDNGPYNMFNFRYDSPQANGAYQIYYKTANSELFLDQYLRFCLDLKCINDKRSILNEYSGFVAHRHDQAILTNLCIHYGIPIRPDIVSQYGTSNPIINHHRRRL